MSTINERSLTAYMKGVLAEWESQEEYGAEDAQEMLALHVQILRSLVKDIEEGCYDREVDYE